MQRKQRGKRVVDGVLAFSLLAVLWPVMLLLAVLVRASMGVPVIFRQKRPGLGGKPIEVLKFRTMNDLRDDSGNPKDDAERVTRVGMFLRRTSLDELPQLLNVIRGEMSLVGPRPLMMEYWEHYTPEQRRRHDVMPGITRWAQIHGLNDLPFSQRIECDLWYVDNWSLWLDLRILAGTVWKVLSSRGVKLERVGEVDDLGLHPQSRKRKGAKAHGEC